MSADLGEITVESFWGAIASFILLQIFGYFIFQTFLVSIDFVNSFTFFGESGFIIFILGIGFLFMFMFFQSISFYKIRVFLSKNGFNSPFNFLTELDELIKFILAICFTIILIIIMIGYYPLPKKDSDFLILISFYIFSWFVSYLVSKFRKQKASFLIAKGFNRYAGIIAGLFFFILGLASQNLAFFKKDEVFSQFAYFLGVVGLGIVIALVCSLLMENQIKYLSKEQFEAFKKSRSNQR